MKQLFTFLVLSVFMAACASGPKAKDPPNLVNTEWLLEDLVGKGVLDRVQATLAFPEPDKVAGKASCNRFFGGVEIKGESIKIGQLGSTMMACESPAVSNQETNYLKALEAANRVVLEGPYLLIYSKGFDKPMRFTQMTPAAKP